MILEHGPNDVFYGMLSLLCRIRFLLMSYLALFSDGDDATPFLYPIQDGDPDRVGHREMHEGEASILDQTAHNFIEPYPVNHAIVTATRPGNFFI